MKKQSNEIDEILSLLKVGADRGQRVTQSVLNAVSVANGDPVNTIRSSVFYIEDDKLLEGLRMLYGRE